MTAERVIAYIDGFNLYFGMMSKGWGHYRWLNVRELARQLLKPHQWLAEVRYFTSRVSSTASDPDKSKRQNTFLEALETLPDTRLYYGHYLDNPIHCHRCGRQWTNHDEKMTDVNIATELVFDAFQDRFETALLVSGDSDLTAPVKRIRESFARRRIVVGFPPNRVSVELRKAASGSFVIGEKKFKRSQLPDEVKKADGFVLKRPESWR